MRKTCSVLLTCLVLACGDAGSEGELDEAALPSSDLFEVIEFAEGPGKKCSLDIRLHQEIGIAALQVFAARFRDGIGKPCQPLFISYYLPGMEVGAGAWAVSHFTPNPNVQIIGGIEDNEVEVAPRLGQRILAKWADRRPFAAAEVTLYQDGFDVFLRWDYFDGSQTVTEVIETPHGRGVRYDEKEQNQFGDYYIVNAEGDLEYWDREGLIAVVRRGR